MLAGLLLCCFADSFELACIGLATVGAGAGLLFPISGYYTLNLMAQAAIEKARSTGVAGKEQSFNVEFTFFGDVSEDILHWDPPHRYVYFAQGDDFPIKDYVASSAYCR